MEGYQFAPGIRFHPTDQELIIHYLRNKVTSSMSQTTCIIADIDIYKFNPWDLPGKAFFGEGEWFFFSPRDRKYPNGSRPNRMAASGYWKATGTDKPILSNGSSQCLGVKKALVFYKGRPLKGMKTDWGMHEYRLIDASPSPRSQKDKNSIRLDDWVLCRVRQKGSMLTQFDEDNGNSGLALQAAPAKRKQQELREINNILHQWSDQQLFTYLLSSKEGEERESQSLEIGSCELNNIAGDESATAGQKQPSHLVSSMLDSIKRTLSFGALDEFMLLPQSKKVTFLE